jgi:uncharacterized membrane protein
MKVSLFLLLISGSLRLSYSGRPTRPTFLDYVTMMWGPFLWRSMTTYMFIIAITCFVDFFACNQELTMQWRHN